MTQADIQAYFGAEKAESLLFVGVGVVSILAGLACFFYFRSKFSKGAAIPLLLVGLIQVVVGGTVYLRTDGQVESLAAVLAQSPAAYARAELPRMQAVNRSFDVYKVIEIGLLGIAAVLIAVYFRRAGHFWLGFGMALALQSGLMLAADLFAERRADVYTAKIESIRE